ncbi:thiamine pyrophosphokinase Thi80 [Ramaria rubella]|nr:thiamine pyrophosphokinase Thi80 [Ramaria rubella]
MSTTSPSTKHWALPFLLSQNDRSSFKTALIILNQPFGGALLNQLWSASSWRACADGGANRLYDSFEDEEQRSKFLPDLIKGDFDSIRDEVRGYYLNKGVNVVKVPDQYSTDLQKCLSSLADLEAAQSEHYTVLFLGGLSGRLDQTVHTLSFLHKLRKTRDYVYAITDDNIGWVLDSGEHTIDIDLEKLGPTCGLLPVGTNGSILSTRGLKWNLTDSLSSFDGLVSTSNHLITSKVWVKTSKPIWWCVELRKQ